MINKGRYQEERDRLFDLLDILDPMKYATARDRLTKQLNSINRAEVNELRNEPLRDLGERKPYYIAFVESDLENGCIYIETESPGFIADVSRFGDIQKNQKTGINKLIVDPSFGFGAVLQFVCGLAKVIQD